MTLPLYHTRRCPYCDAETAHVLQVSRPGAGVTQYACTGKLCHQPWFPTPDECARMQVEYQTTLAMAEPEPEPAKRGNGHTPQPFAAVIPDDAPQCPNEFHDGHASYRCARKLGHTTMHYAQKRYWLNDDAPGEHHAGPAQAAIACITERERAELQQLRAFRDDVVSQLERHVGLVPDERPLAESLRMLGRAFAEAKLDARRIDVIETLAARNADQLLEET